MAARPKLNLPRREFIGGEIHYSAPFALAGVLCGQLVGEPRIQLRVRGGVNCARCIEIAQWIWSHRVEAKPRAPIEGRSQD